MAEPWLLYIPLSYLKIPAMHNGGARRRLSRSQMSICAGRWAKIQPVSNSLPHAMLLLEGGTCNYFLRLVNDEGGALEAIAVGPGMGLDQAVCSLAVKEELYENQYIWAEISKIELGGIFYKSSLSFAVQEKINSVSPRNFTFLNSELWGFSLFVFK